MKNFKRFFVLPALCVTLLTGVGCNKNAYTFYTNMPDDGYGLANTHFELGSYIEGHIPDDRTFEDIDTSNYTLKGHEVYAVMGSDYRLAVWADFTNEEENEKFKALNGAVLTELHAIDKAISATVTNSDVFNFNNAGAGTELEICKTTYEVLGIAKSVYEMTDGYYNPAVYYNIYAYGFGTEQSYPKKKADLPDDKLIEKYTELASHFNEVQIREEEGKYFVTKPAYTVEVEGQTLSMKLDLGGIGKGYAVDRADRLFDEYGYKFGYFNYGTSSMLVKSSVETGAFEILLTNPRALSDHYLTVKARNEKLSTSGDDMKRYYIDGVRYCHIIDPKTGKPIQTGIMSATVLGGSAAEDDALTTAIMAMGKERAIEFIRNKLTDRRVIFTCEK